MQTWPIFKTVASANALAASTLDSRFINISVGGCPLGRNLITMGHSEHSSWTEHSISVCSRLSCISPALSLEDNWRRAGSSYDQGTQQRPKLEALLPRCSSPQSLVVPRLNQRKDGTPGIETDSPSNLVEHFVVVHRCGVGHDIGIDR